MIARQSQQLPSSSFDLFFAVGAFVAAITTAFLLLIAPKLAIVLPLLLCLAILLLAPSPHFLLYIVPLFIVAMIFFGETEFLPGIGGTSLAALFALLAASPNLSLAKQVVGHSWKILLSLSLLWLLSGFLNGDVTSTRLYFTRFILLPIAIALLIARCGAFRASLMKISARSIWISAILGSIASLFFIHSSAERLSGPSTGVMGWSVLLLVAFCAVPRFCHHLPTILAATTPILLFLLLSETRSTLIAAGCIVLFSNLFTDTGPKKRRLSKWLKGSSLLSRAALILLALLAFFSPLGENVVDRFLGKSEFDRRSGENRLRLALTALDTTKQQPVLGIGPSQFGHRYMELQQGTRTISVVDMAKSPEAHSMYLTVLAETGIPSFLLLLFFYFQVLRRKTPHDAEFLKWAFIGILIAGLFANVETKTSFPLVFGLLLGAQATLAQDPKKNDRLSGRTRTPPKSPQNMLKYKENTCLPAFSGEKIHRQQASENQRTGQTARVFPTLKI